MFSPIESLVLLEMIDIKARIVVLLFNDPIACSNNRGGMRRPLTEPML